MKLDHLLYAGPDLALLQHEIAVLGGVVASVGGRHPGQGTHNALIGLGPDQYLELMAPDPDQPTQPGSPPATAAGSAPTGAAPTGAAPAGTFLRSIAYAETPQLFTWCAKVASAADFALKAKSLGLNVSVFAGSRQTPAGVMLRWDLVVVAGHGLGGVVPFFIDWHDSPHPAASLGATSAESTDDGGSDVGGGEIAGSDARPPAGLTLTGLELRHRDPTAVQNLLRALSAAAGVPARSPEAVSVVHADEPELVARLSGHHGPFELRGVGGQLLTTPPPG